MSIQKCEASSLSIRCAPPLRQVREGLQLLHRGDAWNRHTNVRIQRVVRPWERRSKALASLTVTTDARSPATSRSPMRPGGVFLLTCGKASLLAVVHGRACSSGTGVHTHGHGHGHGNGNGYGNAHGLAGLLTHADAAVTNGDACMLVSFEVLGDALDHVGDTLLRQGSCWQAHAVASVLLEQRCAEVCLRRPSPPFIAALLGMRQPTHIKFEN
eukprot:5878627-Pleurochrysis_carterae.AAC.2